MGSVFKPLCGSSNRCEKASKGVYGKINIIKYYFSNPVLLSVAYCALLVNSEPIFSKNKQVFFIAPQNKIDFGPYMPNTILAIQK